MHCEHELNYCIITHALTVVPSSGLVVTGRFLVKNLLIN